MATESVEALIQGGKATAAPPLGPALGPLGVNIGQVVAAINEKTKSFAGMQVPVKVNVDSETKEFTIEIGTPPASALVMKEAELDKGSGRPQSDHVADLMIEQVIKIAKMKEDALLGATTKSRVKEIIGTCQGMGVKIEGMSAPDAIKAVNEGRFDQEITAQATDLSEEKKQRVGEERKRLQAELEKRRAEFDVKAKEIMKEMGGQDAKKIKSKMIEAGIPEEIYKPLLPAEEKKK